jgi:hypothetical protein
MVVPAGTQWHPEKPTSEFGMVEVPHTLDAVRASQHLANVFIDTGGCKVLRIFTELDTAWSCQQLVPCSILWLLLLQVSEQA